MVVPVHLVLLQTVFGFEAGFVNVVCDKRISFSGDSSSTGRFRIGFVEDGRNRDVLPDMWSWQTVSLYKLRWDCP